MDRDARDFERRAKDDELILVLVEMTGVGSARNGAVRSREQDAVDRVIRPRYVYRVCIPAHRLL
jgi:hypothetical protein